MERRNWEPLPSLSAKEEGKEDWKEAQKTRAPSKDESEHCDAGVRRDRKRVLPDYAEGVISEGEPAC